MKTFVTNIISKKQQWIVLLLGLIAPLSHAANTITPVMPDGVDVSQWKCNYCVFEQGYSGEVEAGVGYVSDDSFKFGEYNGLNEKGLFLIGNATAQYRDNKAGYLDVKVRDIGTDKRSISLSGGRQGKYQLFFNYQEIPHYIADHVKTPYLGSGSSTLRLPSSWVAAGSTKNMTELNNSLHDESLHTKRKRFSVGASVIPANHWQTSVEFHHEVRDGKIAGAGAFFFDSAQLILPVDYVTDEAQVSVSYVKRLWQLKLSYYGSFFTNHDTSLTWQNAYTPLVPGATTGQLALPPSNLFHQLLFSGGYQLNRRSRLSANVAIGRMEQDKQLLSATTNTALTVSLPETTAKARVDTLTTNLRLNSQVNEKLRLNASYRYHNRDNKTPSLLFDWVTTDSIAAIARRNLPYSFSDRNFRLNGDYLIGKGVKYSAGFVTRIKDRTHQEVDHTREKTVWGKASVHTRHRVDVDVKLANAQREASGYHLVSEIDPPQNLLMRKYNMADRSRNNASLHVGINPLNWVGLDLEVGLSRDIYRHSELGLTESRDLNSNADVSFSLTSMTSLHLFAGRQQVVSQQQGSQSFAVADWSAQNEDTVDSLGAGLERQLLRGKMKIGGDYLLSHSIGKTQVDSGVAGVSFPELKTVLVSLKFYADYHVSEKLLLHMVYWYENYHISDWQFDGVTNDTIVKVLGLGAINNNYDISAVMGTLRYRF